MPTPQENDQEKHQTVVEHKEQESERPRRSIFWRTVITILVLAVLAGVIAQGIFLFHIYNQLQTTSRSLFDDLLGGYAALETETPGDNPQGEAEGQPQRPRSDLADSLDLLNDLLGPQGNGGQQNPQESLRDLLDALREGGLGQMPQQQQPQQPQPQQQQPQLEADVNDVIRSPSTDVFVSDGRYMLVLDMPGIDPESIRTSVSGKTVTVSAAVREPEFEVPENARALKRERTQQVYQRILELPTKVKPGSTSWDYKDGVLKVTASKA